MNEDERKFLTSLLLYIVAINGLIISTIFFSLYGYVMSCFVGVSAILVERGKMKRI